MLKTLVFLIIFYIILQRSLYIEDRVEQFIFNYSGHYIDWENITDSNYKALEFLIRNTGVDVDALVSKDDEIFGLDNDNCVNLYLGKDEVQYFIASKLLEYNKINELKQLFAIRATFTEQVYRNGVSSYTAIFIDQSGKTNISLPRDSSVLHGKEIQKKLAEAFYKYLLFEESQKEFSKEVYKDFIERQLVNIDFIERFEQVLENIGIGNERRIIFCNVLIEKIGEKGNTDNTKTTEFDGMTIKEGLKFIGLSEDEIASISEIAIKENLTLDKDFYWLRFLRHEYRSPYQITEKFLNGPFLLDKIFDYCLEIGDSSYALNHLHIPTKLSFRKSCESLKIEPRSIVKDETSSFPELKGILKPEDLTKIDFSRCKVTPRTDDFYFEVNIEHSIKDIDQFLKFLEYTGCIISYSKPVLTPKFFEFAEVLEFSREKFDSISKVKLYIPKDIKDKIIEISGEQIDWSTVKPEQVSKIDIAPICCVLDNPLKILLELLERRRLLPKICGPKND